MTDRNELPWNHVTDMEALEATAAIAAQANPDNPEMIRHKSVKELSREAIQSFESESTSFDECLALLTTAQEAAASAGDRLEAEAAASLGSALTTAGHALYDGGREWTGREKFVEATEMFTYAIMKNPHCMQAYIGLSEMQAQLEWTPESLNSTNPYPKASQTMALLEERLQEKPEADTVDLRLDIAEKYRRLTNGKLALESYAKAVEGSVEMPGFRMRVVRELDKFLSIYHQEYSQIRLKPDDFESLLRASRRALIQDPTDQAYILLARNLL